MKSFTHLFNIQLARIWGKEVANHHEPLTPLLQEDPPLPLEPSYARWGKGQYPLDSLSNLSLSLCSPYFNLSPLPHPPNLPIRPKKNESWALGSFFWAPQAFPFSPLPPLGFIWIIHTHTHTIFSHTLSLKIKPSIALHRELWKFLSSPLSLIIPTLPPQYYWINQERKKRCIHWWPPNWPIRSGRADFHPIGSSSWRTPT